MEKQTVPIVDKSLIAKLTKAWDGKSVYVMVYPRQYRVVITDNKKPMFYTVAGDPAGQSKE